MSSIRLPDTTSPRFMTKRAWWLVVLNLLIPGSAQVLAGNRRVGRFGLGATLVLWAVSAAALLLYALARPAALTVATNAITLWVAQIGLAFYAVLWVVLTLDTLRLVRLIRTTPRARGLVAGLAVAALVAVAGSAGYTAYLTGVGRAALADIFGGGQIAAPIDGRYNILLLGGDAGPDRMGLRPDSISVVSVDAATGHAVMFGIPRNLQRAPFAEGSPLWGEFPEGYACGDDCLVSYLYTHAEENPGLYPDAQVEGTTAGIEAMRDAAEGVLGLPLQYYVLIDMQGFSDLIDALGGVTIDVQERLPINGGEDRNGQPINVDGWIEPGRQQMDGYTALWYARSRHGTSDYDRMGRQREVQEAILTQFEPGNVLTKFEGIADAGAQVVKTDIPQAMLGLFVDLAGKARAQPIESLEFVPPTIDVVYPDFDAIHATVDGAVTPPTPSPSP